MGTWSMEVAVRLLWNSSSEIMSFSSWLSISTSTWSSLSLSSHPSQQHHLVVFEAELLRLVEGLSIGVEAVAGVPEWHLSKYSEGYFITDNLVAIHRYPLSDAAPHAPTW